VEWLVSTIINMAGKRETPGNARDISRMDNLIVVIYTGWGVTE
jgi:hypothetical protein